METIPTVNELSDAWNSLKQSIAKFPIILSFLAAVGVRETQMKTMDILVVRLPEILNLLAESEQGRGILEELGIYASASANKNPS